MLIIDQELPDAHEQSERFAKRISWEMTAKEKERKKSKRNLIE